MDKFLRQYNGKRIEDEGIANSAEAKAFAKAFRSYLERSCSAEVAKFFMGHYEVSAFLRRGDRYMYLNYAIPRGGRAINVDAGRDGYDPWGGYVLVRKAEGPLDYVGGRNEFCSISTLPQAVGRLLEA